MVCTHGQTDKQTYCIIMNKETEYKIIATNLWR